MEPFGPAGALLECPSREVLSEFERGGLSDEVYDAVAWHISSCPQCERALQELYDQTTHDSLVDDLRACFLGYPVPDGLAETTSATAALPGRGAAGLAGFRRAADEMLGKTVGDYRIDARIGWGGMGVVYRARQVSLNRDVALKMILAGHHASPQAVTRFRREVEAVARLKSPHVVQVYALGEHEGLPYFSMELAEGGSLKEALRDRGPLPPREAAELVRALALAVQAAHDARVVHRDLKPGNILFDAQGVPKVADFGLAKLLDSDPESDPRLTPTADAFLGTVQYMAPEQASGRMSQVGKSTDVYALGVILYEALTGAPPFDADSKLRTMELVRSADPERPSRRCPDVPFWLESICLKCLEKSPERRYPSAQALADDLGHWLADERPLGAPGRLRLATRSLRRHAIPVLLMLVAVAAGAAAYVHSPDRALRSIQSDLARGRPVELIGKTGGPRWSRDLIGRSQKEVDPAKEITFTVRSLTLNLVELVPDPQTDRYRFSAQVYHAESDVLAEVGLFFGHRSNLVDGRLVHAFTQVCFNGVRWQDAEDRRAMPPEVKAELRLPPELTPNQPELTTRLHSDDPTAPVDIRTGLRRGPAITVLGENTGQWHSLEVDVTPEAVTARWDGQPFPMPMERFRRIASRLLVYTPPPDLAGRFRQIQGEFDPRGGLGLYVRNGLASFRDVRVTPLAGPEGPAAHNP
jgi:serine/threonine-protein kinase